MTSGRVWATDGVMVLTLAAVCFGFSVFKEADVDLGFHVRTGEHVLRTGTIPQKDIFSYTSSHQEWPLHYWMPDVVIYWIYGQWGMGGLILVKAGVVALIFLTLYGGMRRLGVAWPVALALVVWALVISRPRFSIRPLLGSQLCLSVLVVWWMAFRAGRGPSFRYVPVLLMLWANTHAGVVYGGILLATVSGMELSKRIVGGLFGLRLDGLRADRLRSFVLWSIVGLAAAILLVWVMNPKSVEGLLLPFRFHQSEFFMSVIEEYGPVSFPRDVLFGLLALAAVVGFVANRRGLDWTEVAVICVFGSLAMTSVRIIIVFAIVAAPIVGRNLQGALHGPLDRIGRGASPWRRAIAVAAASVVLLAGGYAYVRNDRSFRPGIGFDERMFPEKALDFIGGAMPDGEIFNSDIWGGPMILRLYPQYRVFIDGRQEVYGEEFWKQVYFRILAGGQGWEETLERYGVNLALLRYSGGRYRHRIGELLWASPRWTLVYWDDLTLLFAREVEGNRRLLDRAYRVVDPEAFDAESLRAEGALALGVQELGRRVREDPTSWRARLYLGEAFLADGEPERAREEFRVILDQSLMDAPGAALSGLGDAFYAEGLPDSALACYRAARRYAREDSFLRVREVRALGALGRVEVARREIEKVSRGEDRARARILLGQALIEHGWLADARAVLEEGARENPRNPHVHYALGLAYQGLGRMPEAEAAYREALVWNAHLAEALNDLAWLLVLEGERVGEAQALAERARAERPSDPQILDTLGWIQYLAGDYESSVSSLSQAVGNLGLPHDPALAEIFYHLGRARAASGDPEGAAYAFERALEIDPGHAESQSELEEVGRAGSDGRP